MRKNHPGIKRSYTHIQNSFFYLHSSTHAYHFFIGSLHLPSTSSMRNGRNFPLNSAEISRWGKCERAQTIRSLSAQHSFSLFIQLASHSWVQQMPNTVQEGDEAQAEGMHTKSQHQSLLRGTDSRRSIALASQDFAMNM
jgi:hypothetical protein